MTPVRRRIEIDCQEVFTGPSSPDRKASVFFASPTARPEKRHGALYPTRRLWGLRGKLEQRRRERCPGAVAGDGAPRRVTRAAAKGDEREGEWEGTSASAAKKSRKLDIEKEDALLHMLGEVNKSLQASLKSGEPVQVPEGTSPEEIFEALRGYPDWPVPTCCEPIVCLSGMIAGSDLLWHSPKTCGRNGCLWKLEAHEAY
ncbi:uncharacterized protein LOC120700072 isoform X2 [Panicum virgatum]|uniref:Uncharacterized protein n=1 Tax=Panicum virgatum TaxID=38727 RepID=A0A8T0V2F5_PANVG|nr:uncharacterized protein LOC120700072 isoform X2 [Panicum virgatum]KAG2630632.1 hypothetical protein PVAP13_3KG538600 [Panicum virgatum]